MRSWAYTALMLVFAAVSVASAQPQLDVAADAEDGSAPTSEARSPEGPILGYGAMPGGQRVAAAEVLAAGSVGVSGVAAFGYRASLLAPDHRYGRGSGSLSLAYSPLRFATLGLTLDGHYDRHYGLRPSGEDGYVGEPRLLLRLAGQQGALGGGVQVGVWVPGKSAPSLAFNATTVDVRALASARLGPTTLSVNAGFRFDNSAKSVDDPSSLTPQDQISLGVSEFHAVLASAMLTLPFARGVVRLEGSLDQFIGRDHPQGTLRGGLSGGLRLTSSASLIGFVELASIADPRSQLMVDRTVPLIPYDPRFTAGLGFEGRFGATAPARKSYVTVDNARAKAIEAPKLAEVSGVVVDDAGLPVAGAKVTVETQEKTGTAITDAKGAYRIAELPRGDAKITVELAGKKPSSTSLTLGEGKNPAPQLAVDPELPPGELRGNVRARVGGRAVAGAKIIITPGDYAVTSGADGTFAIEVPPGTYTMTTSADGYATQSIVALIDQEGVTVKFVNLDKK
jgi:hypothetical protein